MNASVDGRILGSRWRPAENRMAGLFERLHEQLPCGCSRGDHQQIILTAQFVSTAAFPVYRHERSELFARAASFSLFLTLALFGRLPLALFSLAHALTLALFGGLLIARLPLAGALTSTPIFDNAVVIRTMRWGKFTDVRSNRRISHCAKPPHAV